MDIEPEFTKRNHAVSAGLNVPTEFVGEGNQCDGDESPSHGGGDLKSARVRRSLSSYLRAVEVHLAAIAVVKSAGEMRTPKRSHQMITL